METSVANAQDQSAEYRAKAYMLDEGISMERLQRAWDSAVKGGNPVVKSLATAGKGPLDLPPHLIKDLLHRHGND